MIFAILLLVLVLLLSWSAFMMGYLTCNIAVSDKVFRQWLKNIDPQTQYARFQLDEYEARWNAFTSIKEPKPLWLYIALNVLGAGVCWPLIFTASWGLKPVVLVLTALNLWQLHKNFAELRHEQVPNPSK